MKRQAIKTTLAQMRQIADSIEAELKDSLKCIPTGLKNIEKISFVIPIINNTGLSDDWKFQEKTFKVN